MILFITKIKSTIPYHVPNYFDSSTQLAIVDYFVMENILIDSFPEFNEELTAKDTPLSFVNQDFQLVISLISGEVSNAGKNIKDFFTDLTEQPLIFKIGWGYDADHVTHTGFVDLPSTTFNLNKEKNGYTGTITVFGAEKQLKEKMPLIPHMNLIQDTITNVNAFFQKLFFDGDIDNVFTASILTWQQRLGYIPIISEYLYNRFVAQQNYNNWQTFEACCKAWGIMYVVKHYPNYNPNDLQPFYILLFFRSDGTGQSAALNVMKDGHEEGITADYNQQTVLLYYVSYQPIPHDTYNWEVRCALVITAGRTYIGDSAFRLPDFTNLVRVYDDGKILNLKASEIDVTNVPDVTEIALERTSFPFDFAAINGALHGGYSLGRCLVKTRTATFFHSTITGIDTLVAYEDTGFNEIIMATAAVEYEYLVGGLKNTKKLKVYYDDTFQMYNIVNFENADWWIERVNNYNSRNKSAEIYLVKK